MIKDLVIKNCSYRRFYEEKPVKKEDLLELIDLARLSSSGANRQPLKYILPEDNAAVFETLGWAGYLEDWDHPEEGERPAAYIIMCIDKNISKTADIDAGIACQNILLGAAEKDLGGCIFGSVNRPKLVSSLNIPENLDIVVVIALGYPMEKVVIEDVKDGNIRYWRDEEQIHHVPKRSLDEILVKL